MYLEIPDENPNKYTFGKLLFRSVSLIYLCQKKHVYYNQINIGWEKSGFIRTIDFFFFFASPVSFFNLNFTNSNSILFMQASKNLKPNEYINKNLFEISKIKIKKMS